MPEPVDPSVEMILQHYAEDHRLLGAVTPPIFQNSLFVFDTYEDFVDSGETDHIPKRRHNYSRVTNPTLEIVERKIAKLEHLEAAKVFTSGMAAISAAIFSTIQQGSHVVAVDTCYGPTRQLLTEYLPKFGVRTTLVSGSDPQEIFDACEADTTAIYLESPSSLVFHLQDFETISAFARERKITTITDNSYCSPIFQTPADFGIDIIVHSATKYLGGHSDVVAGALCTSMERMNGLMRHEVPLFGAALPPFPAWLLIRGLRTLKIRMKAHEETGNRIAAFLKSRPEVERVLHPALPDHPRRDLFCKQMRGTSGLLSFIPKVQDPDRLKRFVEGLEIFQLGVSWGGFESLAVTFPIQPLGWESEKWFVRLHCGLESAEDLIADLDQAFRKHLTP